jgi:outer membrane receptor protein involved in Fe transport
MNSPEKQSVSFLGRRHIGFLAVLTISVGLGTLAQVSPLLGQSSPSTVTPADDRSETIVLSPFVVSEDEGGWIATETVGGTRLRTNYRDVPNQLETLTKEFMQDLGMTNFDDALIYTANSESRSEYSEGPVNDAQFPAAPARVRGIDEATMSRNFFPTRSPTDNYNIDRATVASGPNSILFGLGSPAGILDATPARAEMRNKYGFSVQYSSEDSKRATFDANVVVFPRKLAIRLMGLTKETYTSKGPNFDNDDRIFGSLTFKPFQRTTLIIQGERINRETNRASAVAPFDFVTPWLNANQIAGSGYTSPKPIYNNTSFTGIGSNRIFSQSGENPVMIQGEDPSLMRSWRNSVTVKGPGTLPGVDPTFDAGASYSLLDSSIFPLDVNILGYSRKNGLDGRNATVILEQSIADKLFLELAYNYDKSNNEILSAGSNPSGTNIRLQVDANQFIPGTNTPNPHAGEYYFQGTSANRLQYFDREDWRATLSYEYDAGKELGRRMKWMKWLGRHRLLGLYSFSKEQSLNQNTFQRRILDDPVIPGVTLRPKTFVNWANHASRIPQYRHYLGDPYEATIAFGPFWGQWITKDANGKPYELYYISPYVTAQGKRLGAQAATSGIRSKLDSKIFVWQGYFLPDRQQRDRLILTYGYRKDGVRTATLDNASITQDFSGLYPVLWDVSYDPYGERESGLTRNLGIVARPIPWLSLTYNKSTTFNLNTGRRDPYGDLIPGTAGEGRDYGIRIDLLQNKLSLKLSRFENTASPTRANQQINNFTNQFRNIENRVIELDPSLPQVSVKDGNMRGFPVLPNLDYNISSDIDAKGYEAELNFSPTRNWNIRINGSKGTSVESNIGGIWFDWVAKRLPIWQSVVAKNGEIDSTGKPVTWNTAPYDDAQPTGQTLAAYYQSQVVGNALAFMEAVDGRSNPSIRALRLNGIVKYQFTEGRLKGFNIGAALRYRGAPVIGYGVKASESGTTVLDLDTTYKGPTEYYFDSFAGYKGKANFFGGFDYRIQLNIRNLLDKTDTIPIYALTTGAVSQIITVEPRLVTVTFGVDF